MAIVRQVIVHTQDGAPFESMIVAEEAGGERPGILLFPNVLGTKEADFAYAERVAALGQPCWSPMSSGRASAPAGAIPTWADIWANSTPIGQ